MFNSGVLDVVLGLAVVFILVSTVCTAVREALESVLKTRAAYLEYAIRELLNDPNGDKLARSFFEHPLIRGLFKDGYDPKPVQPTLFARGRDMPSYIPACNFAATLLDIVARGDDLQAKPNARKVSGALVRQRVGRLDPHIQRAVLFALDSAHDDLELTRKHLEAWFDAAMSRVSGWYKRSTQTILFGIALAVVFALNINAISIANTLYRDQSVRAATVAAAEALTPEQLDGGVALRTLDALQLPIGWKGKWKAWYAKAQTDRFNAWNDIVTPLLGLLLTALGATLGAPFWFDVLNRVMVVRATVKPKERRLDEALADASPPRHPLPAPPTPILSAVHPLAPIHDVDADGCELADDDPTPDEALPAATGGVR